MPQLFSGRKSVLDKNLLKDYQVFCGIEEEFLLIDKNGSLASTADELMVAAAEILQKDIHRLKKLRLRIRALDPEPALSQIEYNTLPTRLANIAKFIQEGRKLVSEAAKAVNCLILCQSVHPFDSNPNPLAGTHINISVRKGERLMTPEEQLRVYNHCWNHLPDLIAASANSPVLFGNDTGIASNRIKESSVLAPNRFAQLQIPVTQSQLVQHPYYGRLRYSLRIGFDDTEPLIVMNSHGNRLTDITARGPNTNIGEDGDETSARNRVEIRIFDVQASSARLADLCYLCGALALQAVSASSKALRIDADPYQSENVAGAVQYGLDATFLTSKGNFRAAESIRELANALQPYLEVLNVRFNSALPQGKPEISQKSPPPILTPLLSQEIAKFDQLRKDGRIYLLIKTGKEKSAFDPETGYKYSIPRNTELFGTLQMKYQMKFEEGEFKMIKSFKEIDYSYFLLVRGISVSLDSQDSVKTAMTEEEYYKRRFLGLY